MNGLTIQSSERRTSVPSTFQMTSPLSLIHSRDSFSLRLRSMSRLARPFRSEPRAPSSVVGHLDIVRCMATRTAATVFLIIALAACDKQVGESVEQSIRQLDNERIQAQLHADAVGLDRIYADDFIGVGPSGTVRTKPQVLSDFTSGNLRFQSITTDGVQVRVYENTAVETGVSTMVGQDKGKAVPRDTRFTRVWIKQQGRWRLVANHYSIRVTQ